MDEEADLVSPFALQVFWLNGLLMRNGERITKPWGQSSARWQVLGRSGSAAQTVAEMARSLGQARQSVQRVADALEADGLIAYTPKPGDHRTKLVVLTEAGRAILAAIHARNALWTRQFQEKVGPAVFAAALGSLEQVGRVLEEELS